MSAYNIIAMRAPDAEIGHWRVDIAGEDGQEWRVQMLSNTQAISALNEATMLPTKAQAQVLRLLAKQAVQRHHAALDVIFRAAMWKAGVKRLNVMPDPVRRSG
jgi:hypothetical protein